MASPAPKATAVWVVRRLRAAGFEALLAGGCVRDMLLRRPCADYDVATSATPEQVRKLFPRVLLVGAKFGVAMVIRDSRRVEVATFRSDLSYRDGRRPEGVRFTTAKEDALRRDFTINGMFYDPVAKEVIDHVGGRADLERRIVRTIGDARQRFAEDYLRMLRAVRFSVALGFELDAAAADAIRQTAARIEQISGERVFEELWKMLQKPSAADALRMLADLGLARHVLPEMFLPEEEEEAEEETAHGRDGHGTHGQDARATTAETCWERGVERAAAVASRRDALLTLAALAGELPSAAIAAIVRRGGQSNDLKESLAWLAAHRSDWRRAPDMSLAEFKRLLARDDFERLRALWTVEERGQRDSASLARRILRRARGIAPGQVAPPPLVTGRDLKAMGLGEGRLLGEILRRLYDAQLNEGVATRAEGVELAQKLMRELDAP